MVFVFNIAPQISNNYSYILQSDFLDSDDVVPVRRTQPFIWRTLQQHNTTGETETSCRNSVQGKILIVDDRGIYKAQLNLEALYFLFRLYLPQKRGSFKRLL